MPLALAMILVACTGEAEPTTTTGPVTTTLPPTTTTTEATTTSLSLGECRDAFCVRYHIRPEAAWADGTPVTANDFVFTYETVADPAYDIASREGYDLITGYEVVDEKTVLFAFNEIYAPWQTLFSTILPAHVLEGQPFDTAWDDAITMGSGPFTFVEWAPEDRIVLARNPDYWGEAGGDVQTLNIVFHPDAAAGADALDDGEIDVFYPQPYVSLMEEVDSIDGIEWVTGVGPVWEYFGFNQDDLRLQQLFVRQAFTQGINREAIMDAVVRPITPDAQLLGNSVWLNGTASYEDHYNSLFPYDPAAAEGLLSTNGCVRGEDGIHVCNGERLSFSWATTSDNEARDLHFELARADLEAIGIEITPDFGPTSELLQTANLQGGSDVWQTTNLAWVAQPDPAWGNSRFYCQGDALNGFGALNFFRYCDEEVDVLIRRTDMIIDPSERAATYNQADELWLAATPMIPMYQRPTLLAWNSQIQGPGDNPSQVGPLWNVGDWTGLEEVSFGIENEPESMNVLEPAGTEPETRFITTAVLEGAFTITPDFEYAPLLVESAEPIVPKG
ncbi:MAG TPA: peptide ABC transporter substrate-binding protein [Acidimicrobiia bacterium]|nr:peptide ABC transporter substrate-binding protein [Acidimicrobiia bacterium]